MALQAPASGLMKHVFAFVCAAIACWCLAITFGRLVVALFGDGGDWIGTLVYALIGALMVVLARAALKPTRDSATT